MCVYICAYECVYCILQAYINSPGIKIAANIEEFFDKFKEYKINKIGKKRYINNKIYK